VKFVIVSDRQKWGGMIVLHRIAELLKQNGHRVKIFYTDNGRLIGKNRFPKKIAIILSSVHWINYTMIDVIKECLVKSRLLRALINIKESIFLGYTYTPIKGIKR